MLQMHSRKGHSCIDVLVWLNTSRQLWYRQSMAFAFVSGLGFNPDVTLVVDLLHELLAGIFPRNRSRCTPLLVCSCSGDLPCPSLASWLQIYKPLPTTYGVSMGSMVWSSTWSQVQYEGCTAAQSWLCTRRRWYGVRFSGSIPCCSGMSSCAVIFWRTNEQASLCWGYSCSASRECFGLAGILCQYVSHPGCYLVVINSRIRLDLSIGICLCAMWKVE